MMFQPGNSERSRVSLPVKQERFATAKVRYARTPDCFGEMPIAIRTILFQFVKAMMSPDVLQVGHGTLDFSTLPHRVNEII